MFQHLRSNLLLLVLTVAICCGLYPLALWAIGRTAFRHEAEGSLIGKDGKPVTKAEDAIGSSLIAQPFSGDGYFQPRPSAASYNAAASGASNWAGNNYLLRDRVARQLGPIVKYAGGAKKGQPAGSDVEAWFQKDRNQGKPGIVAQWAQAHSGAAQSWVKADKLNGEFVAKWQEKHPKEVAAWIKENPETPEPKPEDLAVPFFVSWSATHPGAFPAVVEKKLPDGKTEKQIEPVKVGSNVQGYFFDMWLQEHPDADLEPVPADMVTASASGLDPHITLKSALFQLDRVAGKWAADLKREPAQVRSEIEATLREKSSAPLGGLAGVPLVNVLKMNLALNARYSSAK